jgi:glycosyltransferase involved in cell wall biosynthesis
VVHANGIKAALVSVLSTRRPIVWAKHDFSYDGALARFVAGRCRLVVGVSEAVTRTFPERSRVEVVHNGLAPGVVDRQAGRQRLEQALGVPAGEVVALVGRLDPVKGHRELLAVAAQVRAQRPDLRLVFVGGPDSSHAGYGDELRRESGNEASFLGHRDDARELIAGSDLVAIPTVVPEGFPYVGLEALAAGTPVVGYADGGLPELVGQCGRLVPPGDRDALAGAIVSLLADESRRRELGDCGRERVAREFTLDRMAEAMRNAYRRAAAT